MATMLSDGLWPWGVGPGGTSRGRRRKPCAWRSGTPGPRPASSGRCSAGGSVSTTSIFAAPRWKKRRIAPRDCGTARAAAIAAAANAAATAGQRRRLLRAARSSRKCGVSGQSTSSCLSSRARSIRLPQPFERAVRTRLDGAEPDVERGGGLLLGELEQVAAREDVAGLVGQLLELGEQVRALVGVEDGLLGRGGRLARGSRGRTQREVVAPPCGAAAVA